MKVHIFSSRAAALVLAALFLVGASAMGSAQDIKAKRETAPITRADSGPEMYQVYCASCHGTAGKGDGPAAIALRTEPPDLTALSKKYQGTFPRSDFEQWVTGQHVIVAHGNSEMPVWGRVFTLMGQEALRVHNLADYVESLQAK